MKSSTHNNKKLHLHKQAIASLSASSLDYIHGGQGEPRAWSTSIGKCSGIFCCDAHQAGSQPLHYPVGQVMG